MLLPSVPRLLLHRHMQGPGAIRATESGGIVQVEVGPNDREIEIVNGATGERSTHPVEPGKTTSIPLPPAPSSTLFYAIIGKGRSARTITFEVIGSPP